MFDLPMKLDLNENEADTFLLALVTLESKHRVANQWHKAEKCRALYIKFQKAIEDARQLNARVEAALDEAMQEAESK